MTHELICDEAQALHVDRASEVELTPATLEALDQHLEGCLDCRAFVVEFAEFEERLQTTLRDSPELKERAQATAARVLAAIKASEEEQPSQSAGDAANARPFLAEFVAMAIGALLVVVGFLVGQWIAPGPEPLSWERRLEIARASVEICERGLNLERRHKAALARTDELEAEWARIEDLKPEKARARMKAFSSELKATRTELDEVGAETTELYARLEEFRAQFK